jgi:dienelactone hydrolase
MSPWIWFGSNLMPRLRLPAVIFPALLCLALWQSSLVAAEPKVRQTGPWDVAALQRAPEAEWGAKSGLVREVYYAGEPLAGKPTRVFAYYARPATGDGPFPAMVLVHGGGGKAFAEWATLWAERGYAALAMDLAGNGPDGKRLPNGGPPQDDEAKFKNFEPSQAGEMWSYHAVAAVIRGHSLLAAQQEVDPRRIGITGISWGGYLTCIVSGLDDRLKVSVPVYGCGFLHENSVWLPRFEKMTPEQRGRWVEHFDPSRYLPGVACPILFVNGTNDFAYPLDSYQKSYRAVPGAVDLCIKVRLPHGHQAGWSIPEIGLYVDRVLQGGPASPRLGPTEIVSGKAGAKVVSAVPLEKPQLHYAAGSGAWQKREWKSQDATLAEELLTSEIPAERPLVLYFTATDSRGAVASSPHLELKE